MPPDDPVSQLEAAIAAEIKKPEPKQPPKRERLPSERQGLTRTFRLAYIHKDGTPDKMSLYFKTGCYPDGRLGEVFITVDKVGTLASGALDNAAMMISMLLQYGVPLEVIAGKLRHSRFTPNGFTGDSEIPSCSSPLDLLAQWLLLRYGTH